MSGSRKRRSASRSRPRSASRSREAPNENPFIDPNMFSSKLFGSLIFSIIKNKNKIRELKSELKPVLTDLGNQIASQISSHFNGIKIDFEQMKPTDKAALVSLIENIKYAEELRSSSNSFIREMAKSYVTPIQKAIDGLKPFEQEFLNESKNRNISQAGGARGNSIQIICSIALSIFLLFAYVKPSITAEFNDGLMRIADKLNVGKHLADSLYFSVVKRTGTHELVNKDYALPNTQINEPLMSNSRLEEEVRHWSGNVLEAKLHSDSQVINTFQWLNTLYSCGDVCLEDGDLKDAVHSFKETASLKSVLKDEAVAQHDEGYSAFKLIPQWGNLKVETISSTEKILGIVEEAGSFARVRQSLMKVVPGLSELIYNDIPNIMVMSTELSDDKMKKIKKLIDENPEMYNTYKIHKEDSKNPVKEIIHSVLLQEAYSHSEKYSKSKLDVVNEALVAQSGQQTKIVLTDKLNALVAEYIKHNPSSNKIQVEKKFTNAINEMLKYGLVPNTNPNNINVVATYLYKCETTGCEKVSFEEVLKRHRVRDMIEQAKYGTKQERLYMMLPLATLASILFIILVGIAEKIEDTILTLVGLPLQVLMIPHLILRGIAAMISIPVFRAERMARQQQESQSTQPLALPPASTQPLALPPAPTQRLALQNAQRVAPPTGSRARAGSVARQTTLTRYMAPPPRGGSRRHRQRKTRRKSRR